MGTANISGIGKVFAQTQSAGVNSDIHEEDEKISFLDMMHQMSVQPGDELFPKETANGTKEIRIPRKTQPSTDNYDRYRYHENTVKDANSSEKAEGTNYVAEKISDYADDVKEVLKEELGVTDEQMEEAMETLGLTVMDLMNPNLLAELAAKLTGCGSISELLCNGEFMTVMQTVNELTENLLKELGISLEELVQMMQLAEQEPDAVMEELQGNLEDMTETDSMAEPKEAGQKTTQQAVEEPMAEQAADSAVDEVEEAVVIRQQKETVEEQPIAEEENVKTLQTAENTAFKGGQLSENGQAQDNAGQTLQGQNLTDVSHVQGAESPGLTAGQVDVSDIIKQITEFTRITVGKAVTTMEMQLNPEHLGKIYLEITTKAGAVSAHITAQNEVVKEALEAQLVELKENMNQAGVKVDAVEVTVGNHEFEKNLEQNAKQEERQAEEQEKSAKRTRNINLNDLDELSGLMSEEENLAAQMMAEQGNSIDFTA